MVPVPPGFAKAGIGPGNTVLDQDQSPQDRVSPLPASHGRSSYAALRRHPGVPRRSSLRPVCVSARLRLLAVRLPRGRVPRLAAVIHPRHEHSQRSGCEKRAAPRGEHGLSVAPLLFSIWRARWILLPGQKCDPRLSFQLLSRDESHPKASTVVAVIGRVVITDRRPAIRGCPIPLPAPIYSLRPRRGTRRVG